METILARVLRDRKLTDVAFANAVGCRSQHINRLKHGRSRASPELAQKIEGALQGAVKRGDLRPDLWPEMRAA